LDFYELPGGQFGAPGTSGLTPWGTITLTMHDCNAAEAVFDGVDGNLQMSLARLAGVPGETCDIEQHLAAPDCSARRPTGNSRLLYR
jgi:hypothetical protein